jgi:tRNA dimethylallyltransferase
MEDKKKNENQRSPLVVVCGPTGIGKTTAAIDIARRFDGEIIGADAMQVYRRMEIGTAKPSADEQALVRHHLIDVVEPDEPFDAYRYCELARQAAAELQAREVLPVVAGGTGLYIKALLYGVFQGDPPDPRLRRRLQEEAARRGPRALHRRLEDIDPEAAERIHPNDSFRIIRALETVEATGETITAHQNRHRFQDSPYRVFKIGLHMDRDRLYERINNRVESMLQSGFVQEVQHLLAAGCSPELKSMQSLGYRHVVAYLQDRLSWEEAVRTMKRDHRRYAKRQLTWFRSDPQIVWTEPQQISELYAAIGDFLANPSRGQESSGHNV